MVPCRFAVSPLALLAAFDANAVAAEHANREDAFRTSWPSGAGTPIPGPVIFASYRGYHVVYAYPYAPGVGKRAGRASWTATSGLGGRIVPLHARPTPTQVQRSKAIQRSGRDAFPN